MKEYRVEMDTIEVKARSVQALDLQDGESIESVEMLHIPPSGSPLIFTDYAIDPPDKANVSFGGFGVAGTHYVMVTLTGDASVPTKTDVVYIVDVTDYEA